MTNLPEGNPVLERQNAYEKVSETVGIWYSNVEYTITRSDLIFCLDEQEPIQFGEKKVHVQCIDDMDGIISGDTKYFLVYDEFESNGDYLGYLACYDSKEDLEDDLFEFKPVEILCEVQPIETQRARDDVVNISRFTLFDING